MRWLAGLAGWLAIMPALAATVEAAVATPAGKPVEDAAVVLEPLSGPAPNGRRTAVIAQKDSEFIPYVSVVQAGTSVQFPNQDPFRHHVYSFSDAKSFEIKLYAGKPNQPILFDKPGEVAIGCNIHDWMEAYVLVVPTPWFAKTTAAGNAAIREVPAGRYRLRLWHPGQKAAMPEREIEVASAPVKLKLVLNAAPREHKPRHALDSDHY